MDNNPAPGNKAGGLTTVYEKSLGGVTKGGTTPLQDVFLYAEPITTRGFVFMDTPGHDPVSVTGLVAGGANMVAFTTGRGSAYGCKPTPSIKLATNSDIYRRMIDDMTIRNMSLSTQKVYTYAVANFSAFHGRSPDKLTFEDVRAYRLHLISRGLKPMLKRLL
jgi:altronate dehydratase